MRFKDKMIQIYLFTIKTRTCTSLKTSANVINQINKPVIS